MTKHRTISSGRRRWLSSSFESRQPVLSTNVGFKFQLLKVWEFVLWHGGGSRPLAALRSERLARPRFTSRFSAGRSVAWRPDGLFQEQGAWMLTALGIHPRASRRCVQRETAHEVGFAEDGATSGRFIFGSVAPPCDSARRCAPMGARFADHAPWAVSRARRARLDARDEIALALLGQSLCSPMLALVLAPRLSSGGALTVPWSTGAVPHPSVCCPAHTGTGTRAAFVGESGSLAQLGLVILPKRFARRTNNVLKTRGVKP